jgi:hypothetical protein
MTVVSEKLVTISAHHREKPSKETWLVWSGMLNYFLPVVFSVSDFLIGLEIIQIYLFFCFFA